MKREVGTIGDVNPTEYGGGVVYQDGDHVWLEYIEEPTEEDLEHAQRASGGRTRGGHATPHAERMALSRKLWTVYRVDLDDLAGALEWVDWKAIANSTGGSVAEYKRMLHGSPQERALVADDVAHAHSWYELDNYPLKLSLREVEARFGWNGKPRRFSSRTVVRRAAPARHMPKLSPVLRAEALAARKWALHSKYKD